MPKKKSQTAAKKSIKTKSLNKKSRFSSRQLVVFVLIFALVGGAVIWRSLAAPQNVKPKTNTTLAQTGQVKTSSLNPYAPTTCQNEDDVWTRYYGGSLNGSFSSTYTMCDGTDGWNAGNQGLEADVVLKGTLSDMTITSPDGTQTHHAAQTSCAQQIFYYPKGNNICYAVCFVPPFYLSSNTGTSPLAGGIWTLALSGQISSATYTTRSTVADVTFQKTYCPVSQQNLIGT
jgi:hypothetical protein